jgi:hypothetical protein
LKGEARLGKREREKEREKEGREGVGKSVAAVVFSSEKN